MIKQEEDQAVRLWQSWAWCCRRCGCGSGSSTAVLSFDLYHCKSCFLDKRCDAADGLCRGEKFMHRLKRGEENSVYLSVLVVPAQQEVRQQQDTSSCLCIITAEIDGSVPSAPNCSPSIFLSDERGEGQHPVICYVATGGNSKSRAQSHPLF